MIKAFKDELSKNIVEIPTPKEWNAVHKCFLKTEEKVVGIKKDVHKDWISAYTWELISQTKIAKNSLNMAEIGWP